MLALLGFGAGAAARSCVEPPLGTYAVIVHARVVQEVARDRMRVAVLRTLRGEVAGESPIVDYRDVMVWSERDPFAPGSEWLLGFAGATGDYRLSLCASAYLPVEDGRVTVNLHGTGHETLTVDQLAARLAEPGQDKAVLHTGPPTGIAEPPQEHSLTG